MQSVDADQLFRPISYSSSSGRVLLCKQYPLKSEPDIRIDLCLFRTVHLHQLAFRIGTRPNNLGLVCMAS